MLSRSLSIAALVAALAGSSSGCLVSPRGATVIGNVAAAALWTAAIVGTVTVLSVHDAHVHTDHCGCYRRWHDERWVYYYGGHWEYYDDADATWYVYAE